MNLIKPKKLEKGDTIGLLSVSGNVSDIESINRAERYFNSLGYKTFISDTTYKTCRYNAGTDSDRLKALHDFFLNDYINAIVCTCGGYGVLRIIKNVNYDIIKNNPKIFCGYSDITNLLLMIYKRTGLITFHSPMASGDFGLENISKFTEDSFLNALTINDEKTFYADEYGQILKSGKAQGILWGGNLATISSMVGLDFIPNEKFIFFVEDINESAYKIDRMLTQLFNVKNFSDNIAGIAVGIFSGVDNIDFVQEVIKEFAEKYQIPACNGFKISHEYDKFTLPIGLKCIFSADEKSIQIQETPFIG
ncbi:LD-carboxypeptidase [bacterium]|nr:LD-carboxypeptidase [bacterium]